MAEGKKVYSVELQEKILQEATDLIAKRHDSDSSVLGIYLGGSAIDGTFGEYEKPVEHGTEPRMGSDIDVGLVIKDRRGPMLLSEEEQKHYGVRHIGKTEEIPVYRAVDEKGQDILLHDKHPIEYMILTKHIFEGRLSGKYQWDSDRSRPFAERVKESRILKETEELKNIREKYTR
ncbi:MAG: hypothetical protein ACE5FW_02075 [Candidatus Aenigmatarchaeota archaeon]